MWNFVNFSNFYYIWWNSLDYGDSLDIGEILLILVIFFIIKCEISFYFVKFCYGQCFIRNRVLTLQIRIRIVPISQLMLTKTVF